MAGSVATAPNVTPSPLQVLLVDDQETFLRSASLALGSSPELQVTGVLSAGEAAVLLDSGRRVDIALVDLSMPGVNGIETIAWMQRTHPDVSAVLMSTYEPDELPAAARQSGVRYLRKADLTPEQVIAFVRHRPGPGRHQPE